MIRTVVALPFYAVAVVGASIALVFGYIAFLIEGLE